MGFLFGEYGGEFLITFWEFDLCHSCFSSKFSGNGGLADLYCSEVSIQHFEFVDGQCCVFSVEVIDEVFIGIGGFFPDILLWEEVGMGWGCGHISLYNLIFLIVVWGSACVVWDVDCLFSPVDHGVNIFQPGRAQDNVFISTIDDVEQDSEDDSLDADECGSDEFDDS